VIRHLHGGVFIGAADRLARGAARA
jgi:hypothetical protein